MANKPFGKVEVRPADDWSSVVLSDKHGSVFISETELKGIIHQYHSYQSEKAVREAALRD